MSFVEGISAASIDVADPAFAACVGGIALLVGLLAVTPAVATMLRWLHPERALDWLAHLMDSLGLRRGKH